MLAPRRPGSPWAHSHLSPSLSLTHTLLPYHTCISHTHTPRFGPRHTDRGTPTGSDPVRLPLGRIHPHGKASTGIPSSLHADPHRLCQCAIELAPAHSASKRTVPSHESGSSPVARPLHPGFLRACGIAGSGCASVQMRSSLPLARACTRRWHSGSIRFRPCAGTITVVLYSEVCISLSPTDRNSGSG